MHTKMQGKIFSQTKKAFKSDYRTETNIMMHTHAASTSKETPGLLSNAMQRLHENDKTLQLQR